MKRGTVAIVIALAAFAALTEIALYKLGEPQTVWLWDMIL